jgi:very-short-patch-repair endonuclease
MVNSKIISHAKQNFGASPKIIDHARELRKNMTETEKILWSYLRKNQLRGMHFRRQHPYGIYILDFYCFEKDIVIEIDGMIHLKRHEYDNERTEYLESSGLKVIRFTNDDIKERIEWVIAKINSFISDAPSQLPT